MLAFLSACFKSTFQPTILNHLSNQFDIAFMPVKPSIFIFGLICVLTCLIQPKTYAQESKNVQTMQQQSGTDIQKDCECGGQNLPAYPDAKVDQLLNQIQLAAEHTTGLTARMRYDSFDPLTSDEQRRFGHLFYLARQDDAPMRFKTHFYLLVLDGDPSKARDTNQVYVLDGQYLAEIDYDAKTYHKMPWVDLSPSPNSSQSDSTSESEDLFKLGQGPLPLPLELNKKDIIQRFKVLVDSGEGGPADDTFCLLLIPHPDTSSQASRIRLWFNEQTALPIQAESVDAKSGAIKTIALIGSKWNPAIDSKTFDTSVPDQAVAPAWSIHIAD